MDSKTKKRKRLLLLLIIALFFLISTGYFYTISQSTVETNVKIKKPIWNIKFTDVRTLNVVGSAKNYKQPRLTSGYISLYPSFEKVGDQINYKVRVSNVGNLNARVSSINVISKLKDYVDFEYYDMNVGNLLNEGESKYFNIKVTYNPKINTTEAVEGTILLIFTWEQAI